MLNSILGLSGQICIITGAGSGIGKSIATLFAQHGAHVHILDINETEGKTVCDELLKQGFNCQFHRTDVTQLADAEPIFQRVFNQHSKLDILVNSAGIAHVGTVETTSPEDLDRIYSVNIKGVYNCLKAGVKFMKQSGGGAIVNIASVASVVGIPDRFAYSMSKGAVLTMTYSIATDFIKDKIRCNAISPARIHTPFVDNFLKKNYPGNEAEMFEKLSKSQPIGRMGEPHEVASMALYLCSDESTFITGSNFQVDGGFINVKI